VFIRGGFLSVAATGRAKFIRGFLSVKALFIEDYKPLQKSVAKAIREVGWAVDVAADGEEGLWLAENHNYDVIILDLMLPKLPGLNVLARLREKGSAAPILVLTAKDAVEDRMKGLDMGADDYLVKPFFLGELMSRLKALVRRAYHQKDPVIRVGDLEIDTSARHVRRAGQPIELTAREYALLEYLARREGQVVTRTDIWNHVYEDYGGSGSNVVDVYVGYLRKKLHSGNLPALIHTRRGQGYVLQEETRRLKGET
jgi:DNA-binding response OmpR family regulator